jgi:hypothetical protein
MAREMLKALQMAVRVSAPMVARGTQLGTERMPQASR